MQRVKNHWLIAILGHAEFSQYDGACVSRNGVNVCPEAWYLQRTGVERSAAAERRLDAGVRAHQHIGRQTDRLSDLGHTRRWLLIAIALLAAFLLLQVVISQPWMPQL
jgi:hypothetical protein